MRENNDFIALKQRICESKPMRVLEDSKLKPGRQLLRLDKFREILSIYSCGGKGIFFFFEKEKGFKSIWGKRYGV